MSETPDATPNPEKSFSQEDVERIVKERIATAKKKEAEKFADYDDLKKAASRLAEIEAGRKTDLEKIAGERDTWKAKFEDLDGKVTRWKAKNEVMKKAKSLFDAAEINNHDGAAWEYVVDLTTAEDDDAALEARISKAKKLFGIRSVGGSGRNTEPPKPGEKTLDDEIKELEAVRIEAMKNHDPVTAGELSTKIISLKMERRQRGVT